MSMPKIETKRIWNWDRVRTTCVKNQLYTAGSNEDYMHMLDWVDRLYPNLENMYFIAEDICKHSDDQTISNVMFILERDAIITVFDIEGEDE